MQGQIVSHGVLEFKKCRVMNEVQLGSTLNSFIEIIKPYYLKIIHQPHAVIDPVGELTGKIEFYFIRLLSLKAIHDKDSSTQF